MKNLELCALRSPLKNYAFELFLCILFLFLFLLIFPRPSLFMGVIFSLFVLQYSFKVPLRFWLKLLFLPFLFSILSSVFVLLDMELFAQMKNGNFHSSLFEKGNLIFWRCFCLSALSLFMMSHLSFSKFLSLLQFFKIPKEILELIALIHISITRLLCRMEQIRRSATSRLLQKKFHSQMHFASLASASLLSHSLQFSKAWERGISARGNLEQMFVFEELRYSKGILFALICSFAGLFALTWKWGF